MLKYFLTYTLIVFISGTVISQSDKLGYGFRAGLSLSQYDGPSEIGPNGETLETNDLASGFHIGMNVMYKFGDLMGLRGGFMYSQRGTDYKYEGPSYYVLGRNTIDEVTIEGTRTQTINVSNGYLDVPITLYYRIKGFELSGGFNFGTLISSIAGGNLNYVGLSNVTHNPLTPFDITLNYNYKEDKAGEAATTTQNVNVDGKIFAIPTSVGAYYDFAEKDKDLYQTFDIGLIGGLAFYINEGLFLGVYYLHGFNDVDRNEYDISLQELNPDGSYIQRSDENKSRSWQFSIGFSF